MPTTRFRVFDVYEEIAIQDFVLSKDLPFNKGRGYYQLTKPEEIKANKEFVIMLRASGELFDNDEARQLLGVQPGAKVSIKKEDFETYRVFVQSSSSNRKLAADTRFLYEMEEAERVRLDKVRGRLLDYLKNELLNKHCASTFHYRLRLIFSYGNITPQECEEREQALMVHARLFPNRADQDQAIANPIGNYEPCFEQQEDWQLYRNGDQYNYVGYLFGSSTEIKFDDSGEEIDVSIEYC